MSYTYDELSKMNVADLRKIADGVDHEATKGHSTMHKDKLLPALCQALGIEAHVHHHVVGAINKTKIKSEIKQLKVKRSAAIEAKDYAQLQEIRDKIHKLKHTLRKYIV
jgi:protein-arginine kinase activator protein McsA